MPRDAVDGALQPSQASDRRRFLVISLAAALAAPLAAEAQHAGKVYRIGVPEVVGAGSNAADLSAFQQRLRELGYVEGQNLVIEYRSADGRPEGLADLAIELVALKVDVIVTRGTRAAFAAKQATGTTPPDRDDVGTGTFESNIPPGALAVDPFVRVAAAAPADGPPGEFQITAATSISKRPVTVELRRLPRKERSTVVPLSCHKI